MAIPTIGRFVRFVDNNNLERAAIIAAVHSDTVLNLCVITQSGGTIGQTSVVEDPEGKRPFSWHWPEFK